MRSIDIGRLKREINFAEVAYQYGYKLNAIKSTANSLHLKSDVDALVVKKDEDSHWIYFNVHNSSDKGSIVDFIMYRNPGLTFNRALYKIENEYLGIKLDIPESIRDIKIKPVQRDRLNIEKQFQEMVQANSSKYLLSRCISPSVLISKRFVGTILQDKFNNAIFPHIDENGICGYEMRNFTFKGFSKGGIKSVWLSNRLVKDKRLMVVESGIEALSHYSLFNDELTRYLSIGGEPSSDAWCLAVKIIEKFHSQGGEILSGVNRDSGGDGLDKKLRNLTSVPIKRELPSHVDWNDMLTSKIKGC